MVWIVNGQKIMVCPDNFRTLTVHFEKKEVENHCTKLRYKKIGKREVYLMDQGEVFIVNTCI